MKSRIAALILGIGLVAASVMWLAHLMATPTLTYFVAGADDHVELTCTSLYSPSGNVAPGPAVMEDEGETLRIEPGGVATIRGLGIPVDADALVISAAQVSADCANARALRARWTWLPVVAVALGVALGVAAAWPRGQRRRSADIGPAVRPSAGAGPR